MELWSHHTLKIICGKRILIRSVSKSDLFSEIHNLLLLESAMGVNFDTIDTEEVEKYKQAVRDFGTVVVYR